MKELNFRGRIQYDLESPYAMGSTCTLYRAWRGEKHSLTSGYILKCLNSRTYFQDFVREWEQISRLRSPYIVRLYDFLERKSKCFILMEFIDGLNLKEFLTNSSLELIFKEFILFELWNAIEFIHSEKVYHGDIAPQNIMINREGQLKLVDFGTLPKGQRGTAGFIGPKRKILGVVSEETDLESFFLLGTWLLGTPFAKNELDQLKAKFSSERLGSLKEIRLNLGLRVHQLKEVPQTEALIDRIGQMKGLRLGSYNWLSLIFKQLPLSLVLLLFPMFTQSFDFSSDTRSSHKEEQITVKIRTKKWIRISIGDIDYGYSPVDLRLPKGSHTINWKSLYQKGRVVLTLRGQKNRIISDQYFFKEKN